MVNARLCDICLLEDKKPVVSRYSSGFKGGGKYKLDVCEKHKSWLDNHNWKSLSRSKEKEFLDFILDIQFKVETILNELIKKGV